MDDVPDRPEDDETRTDRPEPRPESTGPATDGSGSSVPSRPVRAPPSYRRPSAPAGPVAAADRSGPRRDLAVATASCRRRRPGSAQVRLTDEPADPDAERGRRAPGQPGPDGGAEQRAAPTELPHWTEPPTGQVPAVLARDAGDEGSGSGIGGTDLARGGRRLDGPRRGVRAGHVRRRPAWPWGRSTRPTAPMSTGGRGSSTSTRSDPARPARPSLRRRDRRRRPRSPPSPPSPSRPAIVVAGWPRMPARREHRDALRPGRR